MALEFISKTVTPTGRFDEDGEELLEVVDTYKADLACDKQWVVLNVTNLNCEPE